MGNSREEIPQWIWYNGQFLFQFDEQLKKNPKMTISSFFSDFLTNQGLQNLNIYHTKNQGTVILLLYGLLVIPREIWEKNSTSFQFTTRNKFSVKPPTDTNLDTMTYSPTQSIGVSKTKLVDLYEFAGTRSDVLDL